MIPKKVLVINTVEFSVSGISTVIINYLQNIDHSLYKMDFVVNSYIDKDYEKILCSYNSNIYILDRRRNPIRYILSLIKIFRNGNYDIAHVHGNSRTMAIELFAARIAGVKKRIPHCHNSTCTHKLAHKLFYFLFESTVTDRVACSTLAGKWIYGGKKFQVLQNALNIETYIFDENKRNYIRDKYQLKDSDILIGHVGTFNEQKNQIFLVELMKKIQEKHHNIYMLLIGNGPLKPIVEKSVVSNKLEKRIFFDSYTKDIPGLMSGFDLFIFPSKWEGLGIVMLEAQLIGLACIASDKVPEVVSITDYNIFLSLKSNYSLWVKAIEKVSNLKKEDILSSIHGIERYDIKSQVMNLQKIYGVGTYEETD